jgi:DNA-directed RNA polymerase alpha subunit
MGTASSSGQASQRVLHRVIETSKLPAHKVRPSLIGSVRLTCPCCESRLHLEIDHTVAFDVIDTPVEHLELSTRTLTLLRSLNPEMKVQELTDYSSQDLLLIPGLGRRLLNEIKDMLSEYGLKLRDD